MKCWQARLAHRRRELQLQTFERFCERQCERAALRAEHVLDRFHSRLVSNDLDEQAPCPSEYGPLWTIERRS
mgnify:CR=1 FL=1